MGRDYKLKGVIKEHPYAFDITSRISAIQKLNYYLTKWEYKFLENCFWKAADGETLTKKQTETLNALEKKAVGFHNARENAAYGSYQHSGFDDFEP